MVYKKYNREFIAFAKAVTQSNSRAFDLVQDAYVSAIEREKMFKNMNEYQVKGWFFTTIKNKNIDFIRKQKSIMFIEEDDIYGFADSFEEDIVMRELIDKLPEKYKMVVLLKYHRNLNSREIGEILELSPSTVRSRLSTSLKILKENFGEE